MLSKRKFIKLSALSAFMGIIPLNGLAKTTNIFTNIIKKKSMELKKDIIEHLWKVIISDNSVDQYEANLMRRICGLIYFPDKECAEIKLKLLKL